MVALSYVFAVCISAQQQDVGDPCVHLDRGAALIRLHVYDAEGGSREGVGEGIGELQQALAEGCPRVAETDLLLGDAAWMFGSQHAMEEERPIYKALAYSRYREYLKLRPDDSRARFTFITMLIDEAERRRELRELVRRDPNHARGHLELGYDLVERGDVENGSAHLVAAARLLSREEAEVYGESVVRALRAHRRGRQAMEAEKAIRAKVAQRPKVRR